MAAVFQQQNICAGVLGQAVGQDATGGTGPGNDIVETLEWCRINHKASDHSRRQTQVGQLGHGAVPGQERQNAIRRRDQTVGINLAQSMAQTVDNFLHRLNAGNGDIHHAEDQRCVAKHLKQGAIIGAVGVFYGNLVY